MSSGLELCNKKTSRKFLHFNWVWYADFNQEFGAFSRQLYFKQPISFYKKTWERSYPTLMVFFKRLFKKVKGLREIYGSQTGMLPGIPESAICVQKFDDSLICNSHYLSQFATFFIVARAKRSVVKSCLQFIVFNSL
jgi:hypothetical protein